MHRQEESQNITRIKINKKKMADGKKHFTLIFSKLMHNLHLAFDVFLVDGTHRIMERSSSNV